MKNDIVSKIKLGVGVSLFALLSTLAVAEVEEHCKLTIQDLCYQNNIPLRIDNYSPPTFTYSYDPRYPNNHSVFLKIKFYAWLSVVCEVLGFVIGIGSGIIHVWNWTREN